MAYSKNSPVNFRVIKTVVQASTATITQHNQSVGLTWPSGSVQCSPVITGKFTGPHTLGEAALVEDIQCYLERRMTVQPKQAG